MIQLTYLNGKEFFLNGELIKTIESTPDTLITLTGGERMMVREELRSVVEAWMRFKKQIFGRCEGCEGKSVWI